MNYIDKLIYTLEKGFVEEAQFYVSLYDGIVEMPEELSSRILQFVNTDPEDMDYGKTCKQGVSKDFINSLKEFRNKCEKRLEILNLSEKIRKDERGI